MRILHVGKFWPPYAGGIERAMHDLCLGLVDKGLDVSVLAHATPRQWRSRETEESGMHVRLTACLGQFAYAPVSPTFIHSLSRMIAEHNPQVLHLHMPNPAAFWALCVPAARRLPWVVHWHSDIPLAQAPGVVRKLYPLYRPFENALLRRAKRLIATSPDYRDSSTALRPWRDKTEVIPLGMQPAATTSTQVRDEGIALWPGRGLRLLAVGRLSHYKGFDVLLQAMVHAPEVQLLLIGDGECASQLHSLVDRLGLASRVRLAGALDDGERDAAYSAAELFCLPSIARSEAFGMVLLEAMRSRVPVVASRVPGSGMAHVVGQGDAGCLVPPGDSKALGDALAHLAANPARREQLAQAGYDRWRQHFTLEASAASVANLYQGAVV